MLPADLDKFFLDPGFSRQIIEDGRTVDLTEGVPLETDEEFRARLVRTTGGDNSSITISSCLINGTGVDSCKKN